LVRRRYLFGTSLSAVHTAALCRSEEDLSDKERANFSFPGFWYWQLGIPKTRSDGEVGVTVPDYVAIDVLIVLIGWAVADWIPRRKLWRLF
jgi:hypothetical protein